MITKAIVTEVIDKYKVKLTIPVLANDDTLSSGVPYAITCTIPNLNITFRVGDVVIVGFEDNDYLKPIILGFLYKEVPPQSVTDMTVNTLKVNTDLIVGEVNYLTKLKELEKSIIELDRKIQQINNN